MSEQLAREKNRLQKSPVLLHPGIRAMLAFIEDQLAEVDRQPQSVVQADATMRDRAAVLQSVTGIGAVTTWSLLAYLSEIAAMRKLLIHLQSLLKHHQNALAS